MRWLITNFSVNRESEKFQQFFLWLEKAMPPYFFEELPQDEVLLVAHNLMGFDLQQYFSTINLPKAAIVLCLDSDDADVRVLKNYRHYGIKNYRAYVSRELPPFPGVTQNLRVATIYFTETEETTQIAFSEESKEGLRKRIEQRNTEMTDEEFDRLISRMNTRFLSSLRPERLVLAVEMYARAKTRDHCQYEVRYNEDWEEQNLPSMQIVLSWRNTPKHAFLYQLARTVMRHGLVMKTVNATYIDPYERRSILVMALGLHGANGQAVWDVCDIPDFLRELVTLKYFDDIDKIDPTFIRTGLLTGNQTNLLRAMVPFIHQALVHVDPYIYSYIHIEEALCRHPELTVKLVELFRHKFDPDFYDLEKYKKAKEYYSNSVEQLDTGQEANDVRRKNVLWQGLNFIDHVLKTNFYRNNKTAYSFRLNPEYLDHIPFDRKAKFPELPHGVFFVRGMRYFGFHIRFKELARGGLRTVFPEQAELAETERNNVFSECYNLAYTQQKKNKDIPEGGSKAVIFLQPYDRLDSETTILKTELQMDDTAEDEIERQISDFRRDQKVEYLHQAQRSFIEAMVTIINSNPEGEIRAKHIIDYLKKPEYIYLGPDENMHNQIIQWIAAFAKKYKYKPGGAFISSKPKVGINHKEYGVTSLGVHVYVKQVLKYLGINPEKDNFSVKMSGGPDGDVAGNEIMNLYRTFPQTAKLVALTDGSGTINDPAGLDLEVMASLFEQGLPIAHYPPERLSNGGFLLNKYKKREETAFTQHTLLCRKQSGEVVEDWISGSEMNNLLRYNVHKAQTDIFIPAGGRPRTIKGSNVHEYLDDEGNPTSKAIVEGANLYLTNEAREILEDKGVLIIKDSSANKGGVICSSFEVLCGLTLGDERMLEIKEQLVNEILDRLQGCAFSEAQLLLQTHKETGEKLTRISDKISAAINKYMYQLLDYLDMITLPKDPSNPLVRCFLNYALPTLREQFQKELLEKIPEHHKKAIIAAHVAARMVYTRGLDWSPTIVDILPVIMEDPELTKAPTYK